MLLCLNTDLGCSLWVRWGLTRLQGGANGTATACALTEHADSPLGGDPWAKAHLALEANLQDLLLGALRHVRHHDARCQLQRRVAPHHHPVLRQAGLRFLRARRGLGTLGSVPTCLLV